MDSTQPFGQPVGDGVGELVGAAVGAAVGAPVGAHVGAGEGGHVGDGVDGYAGAWGSEKASWSNRNWGNLVIILNSMNVQSRSLEFRLNNALT